MMRYLFIFFVSSLCCSCSFNSYSNSKGNEPKELDSSFFTNHSSCLKKWDHYYSLWRSEVGPIYVPLDTLKLNIKRDDKTKLSQAIKYVWSKKGDSEYESCVKSESEMYYRYTFLNDCFPEDLTCGASAFFASSISEDMLRNKEIFYSAHDSIIFPDKDNYLESSNIFLNELLVDSSKSKFLNLGSCEISIHHSFDVGHSVDGKRYSYYLDWGVIRSEKTGGNKNLGDQVAESEGQYYRGFNYKKHRKNIKGKETEVIVIHINDWSYYLIGDATTYLDDLIDSCSS